MRVSMLGEVLRILRRQARFVGDAASDAQLLRRYSESRDEPAFTELVRRHGPMVLGVCRRLLRDDSAAEDAFQATFLVLVRKAGAPFWQDSIAGWLHEVAWRVACNARRQPLPRPVSLPEEAMNAATAAGSTAGSTQDDLGEVLDEALASLPQHYRTPLLLCCCQGKTHEEAAQAMGCALGTVKSRLARGRDLLRQRLLRRGVAVPAAALAAGLSQALAGAAVSPVLLNSTVAGAMSFAGGAAANSAPVLLAKAVLQAFWLARVKLSLGLCLAACMMALGTAYALGVIGPSSPAATETGAAQMPAHPAEPVTAPEKKPDVKEAWYRGIVKQVYDKSGSLLVEQADGDQMIVHVTKDTRIVTAAERKAMAGDLKVGAKVRVHFNGQIFKTDPGQIYALVIVIDGPDDPPPPAKGGASLEIPLPQGAVARFGTTRFRAGGMVTALKLSPDGKKLVTNGGANGTFVWDAATGQQLLHVPASGSGTISGDGERLFVLESTQTSPKTWHTSLNVYQIATGKVVQTIRSAKSIFSFALSPDGRTVALEFLEWQEPPANGKYVFKSQIELRDLDTDRVLHALDERRHEHQMSWLRFTADSKHLLAANALVGPAGEKNKPTMRRLDCATGALKAQLEIDAMPADWDGKSLIAAGSKIYDLDKQRLHWASKSNLQIILQFLPDRQTVLVTAPRNEKGQEDNRLVVWDLETDREVRTWPEPRGSWGPFVFSPSGKSCYCGTLYRVIHWDLAAGKELKQVDAPTEPVRLIAFSPDHKYLAFADQGGVYVSDRATGKQVYRAPLGLGAMGLMLFTPDGTTFVHGESSPGSAGYVAVATGTWTRIKDKFDWLKDAVGTHCELSPDGKVLASTLAGPPAAIQLWDWASGQKIGKLEHIYGKRGMEPVQFGPLAFSPDGKRLACFAFSYGPKRVQVWNVADRKLIRDWETPQDLYSLRFIEDGEFVAAGFVPYKRPGDPAALDPKIGFVRIWDSSTGKVKARLEYPQVENIGLTPAFSPDGKLAATANRFDGLVIFRDLTTGKEVGRFRSQVGGAERMAFSPDGRFLAVGGEDTTVLLVDVRQVMGKP